MKKVGIIMGSKSDLPIMQKMGQHVQVDVTALRTYEGFAADVKERVGR